MILADSSVWVDHLRQGDTLMESLLQTNRILMHPFVIGEISLGQLPRRAETLFMLNRMSKAVISDPNDVQFFIDRHKIFGAGIGYVDAHLLVSATLTPEARLWTRDKRLRLVAKRLSIAADVE